jgi:lipopolysaccharide/colanic/teichoic acid biosynthesis glycosyltransferase
MFGQTGFIRGIQLSTGEVGPSAKAAGELYRQFGKRLFDIAFVLTILPFLVPLIAGLAIFASFDTAPPFFGHRRVGQAGRPFRCWKIRTMVPHAEDRLCAYLDANPAEKLVWERDFKLPDDPRLTQFGRLLRKSSLDELPQFLNVLLGEMSVVGPRPVTGEEIHKYGAGAEKVLSVRPGITGPWQVGARNACRYDERVALDLQYVQSMSFWGDVKIIGQTIMAVLRRTGR